MKFIWLFPTVTDLCRSLLTHAMYKYSDFCFCKCMPNARQLKAALRDVSCSDTDAVLGRQTVRALTYTGRAQSLSSLTLVCLPSSSPFSSGLSLAAWGIHSSDYDWQCWANSLNPTCWSSWPMSSTARTAWQHLVHISVTWLGNCKGCQSFWESPFSLLCYMMRIRSCNALWNPHAFNWKLK